MFEPPAPSKESVMSDAEPEAPIDPNAPKETPTEPEVFTAPEPASMPPPETHEDDAHEQSKDDKAKDDAKGKDDKGKDDAPKEDEEPKVPFTVWARARAIPDGQWAGMRAYAHVRTATLADWDDTFSDY